VVFKARSILLGVAVLVIGFLVGSMTELYVAHRYLTEIRLNLEQVQRSMRLTNYVMQSCAEQYYLHTGQPLRVYLDGFDPSAEGLGEKQLNDIMLDYSFSI
jgi:hypothetical protein